MVLIQNQVSAIVVVECGADSGFRVIIIRTAKLTGCV